MLALLLVTLLVMPIAGQSTAPDVEGLWRAKKRFGPDVKGTLTIEREGNVWRAEIAGQSAAVSVDKERISFALPTGEGSFRGYLRNDRITGHWIQQRTVIGGLGFATPVTLEKQRPNRWRGLVSPAVDELTLFLPVMRKEDGTFSTFIRNPERNIGMFQRAESMVIEGNTLRLVGPRGVVAEGQYVNERLAINIPNRGGWYDFERATPADEARFYPRAKTPPAWTYRKPALEDDGWPVATPEEVGLAREELAKFVQHLIALPVNSLRGQDIHAVLVARHGKLVLEEYFHGMDREELHDLRSAAKILASLLAGTAKLPASTKVYATMNEPTDDPRAQALTLEHLLLMSSGLDCDDSDENSPGREDAVTDQDAQPDWFQFTLDLKMTREPGQTSVYCSVQPNLAGGVVAKATGRWLPDLFRETVAEPMQMRRYALNLTPTGEAYFGGGARFTARDFLKFAQLMLDGGTWRGRQIVSAEWARKSIAPLTEIRGRKYGYLWWIIDLPYRGRTVRAFYAGGNGGQTSMGIPELGLSIAIFGGNYADTPATLAVQRELIPTHVLPAVK
jgi:CubicO group peptidase (beta-lactamase class C family)